MVLKIISSLSSLFGKNKARNEVRNTNLEETVEDASSIMGNTGCRLISKYPDSDYTELTPVLRRKNLYEEAILRFGRANGNIEGEVYKFMKEFVFSNNDFDYDGIEKAINYFKTISSDLTGDTKQALESARTVLLHLNDYLSRENRDKKSSFKKYLFGENGVLTQRRLNDMKSVTRAVNKYKSKIKERRNYVFSKGDGDKFNIFNLSYTKDKSGRHLVNINDDNSEGMYTNHGRLYWESFDQMFDGGVNTRRSITRNVKKYINNELKEENAVRIRGYDWKKKKIMDYAYFR